MSGVDLTDEQRKLRKKIEGLLKLLKDELRAESTLSWSEKQYIYSEMAKAAHELHMSLEHKPKHSCYMIENRGVDPEDIEFYCHIHPVEDLLAYLDDTKANDLEDQTLGHVFKFRVYSHKWGQKATYHLTRNIDGWFCEFKTHNEQGDKSGYPILYKIFNDDAISYPHDLPRFMGWLWTQACEKGLSHSDVQKALEDLADWVSHCERCVPRGIFRGFK